MAKKSLTVTVLLLRILTLAFLATSLDILVTVTVTDPDSGEKFHMFKELYSYRYAVSVDDIGGAYTFVQVLFSVISLITGTYFGRKLHIWLHQVFDLIVEMALAAEVEVMEEQSTGGAEAMEAQSTAAEAVEVEISESYFLKYAMENMS